MSSSSGTVAAAAAAAAPSGATLPWNWAPAPPGSNGCSSACGQGMLPVTSGVFSSGNVNYVCSDGLVVGFIRISQTVCHLPSHDLTSFLYATEFYCLCQIPGTVTITVSTSLDKSPDCRTQCAAARSVGSNGLVPLVPWENTRAALCNTIGDAIFQEGNNTRAGLELLPGCRTNINDVSVAPGNYGCFCVNASDALNNAGTTQQATQTIVAPSTVPSSVIDPGEQQQQHGGIPLGPIIGGVLGAVGMIAVGVFCYTRRTRKKELVISHSEMEVISDENRRRSGATALLRDDREPSVVPYEEDPEPAQGTRESSSAGTGLGRNNDSSSEEPTRHVHPIPSTDQHASSPQTSPGDQYANHTSQVLTRQPFEDDAIHQIASDSLKRPNQASHISAENDHVICTPLRRPLPSVQTFASNHEHHLAYAAPRQPISEPLINNERLPIPMGSFAFRSPLPAGFASTGSTHATSLRAVARD
ncbi:hypothetical protein BDZ88DRAFT_456598 [Geranomyces variabilis]|nr:hypothetical protein BDZ88DRAFT_456598 [Geranomyces variabilis]